MYMLDDKSAPQVRIALAMKILDEVVPRMFGARGASIVDRLAIARTWYYMLKHISSKYIPDISKNPDEWTEEDICKIAEKLVLFARDLLGKSIY